MALVALVTLIILLQYLAFMALVGRARVACDIKAPAVTGHEDFERAYRVQMNTAEQLLMVLPGLWICAYFFNSLVAALLGLGFFLGRILYRNAYVKDPPSRGPGMMIGFLATAGLLGCGLWGVITAL